MERLDDFDACCCPTESCQTYASDRSSTRRRLAKSWIRCATRSRPVSTPRAEGESERHVLGHGQRLHKHEMLMDHAYPGGNRVVRPRIAASWSLMRSCRSSCHPTTTTPSNSLSSFFKGMRAISCVCGARTYQIHQLPTVAGAMLCLELLFQVSSTTIFVVDNVCAVSMSEESEAIQKLQRVFHSTKSGAYQRALCTVPEACRRHAATCCCDVLPLSGTGSHSPCSFYRSNDRLRLRFD